MSRIESRVGIQQRILPAYRIPFFDLLASDCSEGLSVFAGDPLPDDSVLPGLPETAKYYHARNRRLPGNLAGLLWQTNILDWVSEWNPEVLICEANPRTRTTLRAVREIKRRNGKTIGWGLGAPEFSGTLSIFKDAFREKTLLQYDALIAYSETGAEQYARAGVPEKRIFTACNAVAPRPAHPAPIRKSASTARELHILFVGRLQARKRVDLLLDACSQLPESIQPGLWVVGDGPELHSLKEKARKTFPRAEFFGALQGKELDEKFTSADLFVLPGTGGLAVQQAMSFALPVIVAEADGTQADLVRTENGWQIPSGNLDELTKTLTQALRDISRLREMGLDSYRIVAKEINLEKMVTGFKKAITFVLSEDGGKVG
jgi:glycosyltransferase involved in cell wall biosynthesis